VLYKLEQKEWKHGAKNARAGMSLSQSYKHIDRHDHDLRAAHGEGWIAMQNYLTLKAIDEKFLKESVDICVEKV
jgi:hypothetical protein